MSGSIETMPTQPTRRSPKCTLPSRPPVMPPARPMYWPKMRAGRDAADQVRGEVAVQDAEPVVPVHRPGRAGRDGLLAEAVVEGAGHLALAVEHHRPLLDAAHREHRPQEPDPVLQRQVLADECRDVGPGPSRFRRHRGASTLSSSGAPGSAGAPVVLAAARGIAAASPAVSGRRLPSEGWRPRRVERLWPARLRWRMRGAWLWPAFFVAHAGRRDPDLACCRPTRARRPGWSAALLLAGFANLFLVAVVAPLAGGRLRRRRPDLPRLIAADYAGTALLGALAAAILVAGLAAPPGGRRPTATTTARCSTPSRGYVRDRGDRVARRACRGVDARELRRRTVYRVCVPGRDPRRWLCLIVDTDRAPRACGATTRWSPTARSARSAGSTDTPSERTSSRARGERAGSRAARGCGRGTAAASAP